MAPTIAYNEWARTRSIPELVRLRGCEFEKTNVSKKAKKIRKYRN